MKLKEWGQEHMAEGPWHGCAADMAFVMPSNQRALKGQGAGRKAAAAQMASAQAAREAGQHGGRLYRVHCLMAGKEGHMYCMAVR